MEFLPSKVASGFALDHSLNEIFFLCKFIELAVGSAPMSKLTINMKV
jgi:hypothetical protein